MDINKFLSRIFGNKSTRDMKLIQPWVNKVKEASESALTLSPSVAYPAKERFGLSLENELHMTGYGIGDIELPFVQEEVAS